jgi:hypothetical protein
MSPEARERSFDALATGLASGSISRGRALKLMGAALIGGTLASLGIGEAAADEECKPVDKKCRKNAQCCSGNCSKSGTSSFGICACQPNDGSCSSNDQCCSGNCVNGTCAACPAGRVLLSNGTCALPCTGTISRECPADCGSFGGGSCAEADAGGLFCRGDVVGVCAPGGGCPTGSFCRGGACVEAC